jgi:predicted ATP-grasp superfamily ATP-dependent carboligase
VSRVLVVEDGASTTALAAVRALAKAGWYVGLAAPTARPLAGASRAVRQQHRIASPADLDGFAASVAEAVRAWRYDVLLGVGDAEVLALSARRDALGAAVPYAADEVVRRAFDKAALTALARECGVGVPEAAGPETPGPVVVKAALHWAPGEPALRRDTMRFPSYEAARWRIEALRDAGAEAVVQQALPGDLTAYVTVRAADGTRLAEVQQRATRVWPAGAGNTARGVTVPVNRGLADACARLLDALGWVGLAQLEFVDDADGVPRLVDLNGRCYGSLALAVKAGVNLPAIWAASALGETAPAEPARTGVRYQRLEDDLRRALRAPRGRTDVVTTVATAFVSTHGVWSPRDPRPASRRVRQLLGR